MEIKVLKDILSANDQIAQENRRMLDDSGVLSLNVMATPGAGKTSLILQTISGLKAKTRIGVIEGDISSTIDAERVAKEGVPVLQINTGGECHLDANMLQRALKNMPLKDIDLLIVENVGNLICTAEFKLGVHKNVVISSVPEGHDKPLKYPLMFTVADVILVNKMDLLPYSNFDLAAYIKAVKGLNPKVDVIDVSCTTGEGIKEWLAWLRGQLGKGKSRSK
jgi:hydrogenase nickel incorporation protein HypB